MFPTQKLRVVSGRLKNTKIVRSVRSGFRWVKALPLKVKIATTAGVVIAIYALVFVPANSVQLSYSGETCVDKLTFLPGLHRTVDESRYKVEYQDFTSIGGNGLFASRACFTPMSAPTEGTTTVSSAPWGSWLARSSFAINAPPPPQANLTPLIEPIPATKPITVSLSEPDELFDYQLVVADKPSACEAIGSAVTCPTDQLQLEQGKSYPFSMQRSFTDGTQTMVGEGTIKTLTAVQVTESSIDNDQTVYAKPTSFTFTTDKELVSAQAVLESTKEGAASIPATVSVKGKQVTVAIAEELPREADYRLRLEQVEATDGSTLLEPYPVKFKLSGGPKVTGVSIGKVRVNLSQSITVTFDQAIADKLDVKKFVTVAGGNATVTKVSDTQVRVSLQSLPKCQDFTIKVAKGVPSKYDVVSSDNWSHSARTICHTISRIGSSVRGRPIYAYHFGNSGPTTLYVGAIHGNEASSSFILQDWINDLEANPKKLAGKRVVVVPNANPDGLAARSRNNANNVNISRNFPTDDWVSDINDTNGPQENGGGEEPLSEPEAKALANISRALRPRLMISYHAVGSVVIGDPGGYSAGYAARYAALTGYRNATGASSSTFDYDITGSYESWTIEEEGIPSMIVELGSYSYRNFNHHRNAFWAMLD